MENISSRNAGQDQCGSLDDLTVGAAAALTPVPHRDRAYLDRPKLDGTYRVCRFPCQKLDANGEKIKRMCSVSVASDYAGKSWSVSGPPDAPTLSPSIDCERKPCWHGHIINGELV